MKTYRIGRGQDADIVIANPTVSRDHADLIVAADGRYFLIDRNSANGSFRRRGGEWIALSKDYVAGDEPIRLGSAETTVAALLSKQPVPPVGHSPSPHPPARAAAPADGPVERNSWGIPQPKR